ncbi:TRAP transporter substrate-binding protein [Oceanicella actignis]|uniref:TRAP-type C4-dicarboxylate transport system, substrate-binding protein n=1 Tax=Oceanicella actignis TaxID=1189325 RepID=A0A1M7RVC8_9RHOB|nr:TRAP transporter substrate-binding protein [Oceanicella actignis]SET01818.1 TRAP-type C4-dicarboxylate transport system, substrate-binding protein [Oceanicella actignis]SHN50255.1 TRAP-type C4-dicarboxylate transport system, substrate-binding protein [Oceanicella actignis]
MKRILLAAGGAMLLASAAAAETWDMPMAYADGNYHTQNGKLFAQAVGLCTGGDLKITVHGGGSLFKGNEIKRAVQTGQAQIGERLLSAHQNENPLFGVDSVPFLATSFEASDKLWNVALPRIEAALEAQNLVYLYSVPWPPQGLYVNKPVESLADLKGLKFRAYNAATARLAELAGMVPVQIEAAELSQALATGVAEAFISSGSTGYDRKVWEHLSHFYDAQAWLPRNTVFVNKDAWDGLSEHNRNCLRSAAMMARVAGTTRARELSGWYLQQLAANGMKVQAPGPQLAADLEKIGKTMAAEWAEAAGADGKAILEAFAAAR